MIDISFNFTLSIKINNNTNNRNSVESRVKSVINIR